MSDNGLSSNGWANALNNNRLLDPSGQLNNHLNMSNELVASNLNNLTNLNQLNNASLFSSAADSNDSNDDDSRDSLRGSNSEINLNGDGKFFLNALVVPGERERERMHQVMPSKFVFSSSPGSAYSIAPTTNNAPI